MGSEAPRKQKQPAGAPTRTVFDDRQQSDAEPARFAEPHSAYLNRSTRTDFARVRDLVEDWFSRFPPAHRSDLRGRLRSKPDAEFNGAFFELYLHELLCRLGFDVEVHPPTPAGTDRRPDFLAHGGSAPPVYLEARVAHDESDVKAAAERRTAEAYDALNDVESPDFFLSVEVDGASATSLPTRRLRTEVTRFLRALDYDQCAECLRTSGLTNLPRGSFHHDGLTIVYSALPKDQAARGLPGIRPVGMMGPARPSRLDYVTALRTALKRKASRYGDLASPYVIAVNVISQPFIQERHVLDALFGSEYCAGRRLADGVWSGPDGPRQRRVSAVLVVPAVYPWTVAKRRLRLYHHPWAHHPYSGQLDVLPAAVPTAAGTAMKFTDGRSPHDLFGLPQDWPGA